MTFASTQTVPEFQSQYYRISGLHLSTTLLDRLINFVGISGAALNWFISYLKYKEYFVPVGNYKSV